MNESIYLCLKYLSYLNSRAQLRKSQKILNYLNSRAHLRIQIIQTIQVGSSPFEVSNNSSRVLPDLKYDFPGPFENSNSSNNSNRVLLDLNYLNSRAHLRIQAIQIGCSRI